MTASMSEVSVLNEPALRSVIAAIDLDPSGWNQRAVMSPRPGKKSPAYDLAGFTCALAGLNVREMLTMDPTGLNVRAAARYCLGLNGSQARHLFRWFTANDGLPHPDVTQLKKHVTAVTGLSFHE